MFASSGVLLPLPTRVLLAVSAFLEANFLYLLAAGGVLFALARAALSRPEARRDWDRGKLTWPLSGRRDGDGDVPGDAVPLVAPVRRRADPPRLRHRAGGGREHRDPGGDGGGADEGTGGAEVARALGETTPFPELALQMIAVGEEPGRLEEMLASVADTYEDRARRSLKTFSRSSSRW